MELLKRLLTQLINSFFLSFTISCVISLMLMGGPSQEWLQVWLRNALIAWPLSFTLVQFTLPFARFIVNSMFRGSRNKPDDLCEANTSVLPVITKQIKVATSRIDLP